MIASFLRRPLLASLAIVLLSFQAFALCSCTEYNIKVRQPDGSFKSLSPVPTDEDECLELVYGHLYHGDYLKSAQYAQFLIKMWPDESEAAVACDLAVLATLLPMRTSRNPSLETLLQNNARIEKALELLDSFKMGIDPFQESLARQWKEMLNSGSVHIEAFYTFMRMLVAMTDGNANLAERDLKLLRLSAMDWQRKFGLDEFVERYQKLLKEERP